MVRKFAKAQITGLQPYPRQSERLTAAEALTKASANGKYSALPGKIEVKVDCRNYSDFHDYEKYPAVSYGDYSDLPAGYWVCVCPDWYIWKTCTQEKTSQ